MKLKKSIYLGLFSAMLLTACSSAQDSSGSGAYESPSADYGVGDFEDGDYSSESIAEGDYDDVEREDASGLIGEKVIRDARMEFQTLNFQSARERVDEVVAQFQAYVEYSEERSYTPSGIDFSGSGNEYRTVDYTIRVAADSFAEFLQELETMDGYKVSETIGSEDITHEYRDIEARINVLQNTEDRLTALLDEADSIENILTIERQLSDTIQEREALQSRLDGMDSLVDYATVRLTVSERPRISEVRGDSLSFGERVREAILDTAYSFYYGAQDLFIAAIYGLPYIVVLGIVLLIVLFIVKKSGNKKKDRKSLRKKNPKKATKNKDPKKENLEDKDKLDKSDDLKKENELNDDEGK